MKPKPHIEVILPIYNEVRNIEPLLNMLDEVQFQLSSTAKMSYLFINDGSKDGSEEILHQIYRDREDVRVIDFIHNFGHGSALFCGVEHFHGDVGVFMDADLQDNPYAIVDMFNAWMNGAKTVVAERNSRKEKGKIFFQLFYLILHKIAQNLPPIDFGTFCLLDNTVIQRLKFHQEKHRYFPGLVTLCSNKIHSVKVDRLHRKHGKSRVGTWGLISLAITAFISFSITPVRLVSLMGLLCSIIALGSGITFIAIKIFTPLAIPGWASVMTLIALSSGIQLLCLGMIGEYMARLYEEVKGRPNYIVERVLDRHHLPKKSEEVA